jgi:UDP-galactopyranose mutase
LWLVLRISVGHSQAFCHLAKIAMADGHLKKTLGKNFSPGGGVVSGHGVTKKNKTTEFDESVFDRLRRRLAETSQPGESDTEQPDVICFSHLRWDFVYQRPQHLLNRCAANRRVFFVEEPIFDNGSLSLEISARARNLYVVVPHLPEGLRSEVATNAVLKELVHRMINENNIREYILWYYTPMALDFTSGLRPRAVVYDCMDELSAFKGAPERLVLRERELFTIADLVFTGGHSLYEAKRNHHPSVHAFPSSIDRDHFMQARRELADPIDQQAIPHPRFGFFGVIDERFDTTLLEQAASRRPDWQFVIVGPVVKIHPDTLPRQSNIHYLGSKTYQQLPAYIASWDVALLPFAQNESTRFISPTKTPEYLAAGKPVVSTPIRDVIHPYGDLGLVSIVKDSDEFIAAAEEALARKSDPAWLNKVDAFLANMSWDETWERMWQMIDDTLKRKSEATFSVALPDDARAGVAA